MAAWTKPAVFFFATATAVASAWSHVPCPGSESLVHAGYSMKIETTASCDTVAKEMQDRIKGVNGWVDPHNAGNYTILSGYDGSTLRTQRATNSKKAVGGKVYIDKQLFTFEATAQGCDVSACSESQGTSVYDFSTNYCDLRNLYCNDAVCHPITSFGSTESDHCPRVGSGWAYPSRCGPSSKTFLESVLV